ncbi:MAG: metallophosphoesterase, partial [Clostridia bacterium]|nr:metallophosphoesterase [Clostridia bacterium]
MKKKRKVKKVLLIILAVIAVVAAVTAIVNTVLYNANLKRISEYPPVVNENAVKPEKDENGVYSFTTDRELKIVDLTDIHIGGGWMSFKKDRMAFNAVAAMVTAEKPDLVVITGDLVYPVPFQAGTFNNKLSSKMIIALMEQLQVPWTVIFGNHDTESYSYFSREDVGAFYSDESLEYCLFSAGPEDVDGVGNYNIHVKNSQGKITQELIFIDSHSYTDGDIFGIFWKYDNVHQNQVDWYEERILEAKKNNPDVKSLVFLHIPLVEYRDAYTALTAGDESVKYISGNVYEKDPYVYCGMHEDNLFEKALELGSTQGFFCGHDHD